MSVFILYFGGCALEDRPVVAGYRAVRTNPIFNG